MQITNDELLKIEKLKEQFEKIEILDIKDERVNKISSYIFELQKYINACISIEDCLNSGATEQGMGYLEEFQSGYKSQITITEKYYAEEDIYNNLSGMYKDFYPDLADELIIPDAYTFEKNLLRALSFNSKARDLLENLAEAFKTKTKQSETNLEKVRAENVLKKVSEEKKTEAIEKIREAEMIAEKTKQVEEVFFKKAYEPMIAAFDENEKNIQKTLDLISVKICKKEEILNEEDKRNIRLVLGLMEDVYKAGTSHGYIKIEDYEHFKTTTKTEIIALIEEFEATKKIGNQTPEEKIKRICEIKDPEKRKEALLMTEKEYDDNIEELNNELKKVLKESLKKPSKESMETIAKLKEYIQKATADKIVFQEYKQKELSNIEREQVKTEQPEITNDELFPPEETIVKESESEKKIIVDNERKEDVR